MKADIHYVIPPIGRLDRDEVMGLIEAQKYFILHAPRQTGKTSSLLALVDELNATGRYRALYINIEGAQAFREDIQEVMGTVLSVLVDRAKYKLNDPFPEEIARAIPLASSAGDSLRRLLAEWSRHSELPICLMIDEIDALVGDSLISVLRQLRAGYPDRPRGFPQTVVLCGVRDLKDYRIQGTREVITGGSAFNIKAESLRLGDFTMADIRALYTQHTAETGQMFEEEVFPLVWELTNGQPWLVNALAQDACFKLEKDRSKPITAEIIHNAKERMILGRETHLDQLSHKLSEPRVRRVIQPILLGEAQLGDSDWNDDIQYVMDLGLIRRTRESGLEIANGIYREVIPRELTYQTQIAFEATQREQWYRSADGRIDMRMLLEGFQQFFRENSESWIERFKYKEAGPQLLLQAFLQRIVNGGGRIDREYALGSGRTDLLVVWKHPGGWQRSVVEVKVVRGSVERTIAEGLPQTARYMDRCGAEEGHLVLFDRREAVSWEERVFQREEQAGGRRISVWGM